MAQMLDPDHHRERLYRQTTRCYDLLENGDEEGAKLLSGIVQILGRVEELMLKVGNASEQQTGSSVRKYAAAFTKADAVGRGAKYGPDTSTDRPDDDSTPSWMDEPA